MKTKAHQNKFMRIITMPIKALAKARDFYVRSMNSYAEKACYGGSGWGPSSYADPLPRSFSTNSVRSSDNDDFKELIRAASTNTLGNRIDLSSTLFNQKNEEKGKLKNMGCSSSSSSREVVVPRSASVSMAKIEEDKPCEFGDFDGVNNGGLMNNEKIRVFPRSRTYANGATKRPSVVF